MSSLVDGEERGGRKGFPSPSPRLVSLTTGTDNWIKLPDASYFEVVMRAIAREAHRRRDHALVLGVMGQIRRHDDSGK